MQNEDLSPVGEESALEAGLPTPSPPNDGVVPDGVRNRSKGASASTAGSSTSKSRLSLTSELYDLEGNGTLDEAEQKQMFNMKRVIAGLGFFTVVLALSNLGTAWAAAVLARDTTVDGASGTMYAKSGAGEMVGTKAKAAVFDAVPMENDARRKLDLYDGEASATFTVGNAIKVELGSCDESIRFRYTCGTDGDVYFRDYKCEGASMTAGGKKFTDGAGAIVVWCPPNNANCDVSGLSCPQPGVAEAASAGVVTFAANSRTQNETCYTNEECQADLFCRDGDIDTTPNKLGECDKKDVAESCSTGTECASGLCDLSYGSSSYQTCVASTCHDGMAQFTSSSCDPSVVKGDCVITGPYCCANSKPMYITGTICECSDGIYACMIFDMPQTCTFEMPITGGDCTAIATTTTPVPFLLLQ